MAMLNTVPPNSWPPSSDDIGSGGVSPEVLAGLANKADIATNFSDLTNYTAGDLVYYDGALYEFQVDHTAGAWESSEAIQKDLSDIISSKGIPDYSTTEQDTGIKWIDGKSIYLKVINTPITIVQNDTWYDSGLTGIDSIINYFPKMARDGEQIGNTFNGGTIDYVVRNNEMLVKGVGFGITDTYIIEKQIIFYTKVTT